MRRNITVKKINCLLNLFGYKDEKIIFYDFTSGKIEENGRK